MYCIFFKLDLINTCTWFDLKKKFYAAVKNLVLDAKIEFKIIWTNVFF
jgi:hypothetical protein